MVYEIIGKGVVAVLAVLLIILIVLVLVCLTDEALDRVSDEVHTFFGILALIVVFIILFLKVFFLL